MFDAIAPRYDLMNRLMTLGLDRVWRRATLTALALEPGLVVVDLGCGTGDLSAGARAYGARPVGVDLSQGMLVAARGRDDSQALLRADASRLPLADASCDRAVSGFALRNFDSIAEVLADCARVMKPGGRLALLEIDRPEPGAFATAYDLYFRRVMPAIGAVVSSGYAYRYLASSTVYLPTSSELRSMLETAGFHDVAKRSMTAGTVQIVTAVRSGGARRAMCVENRIRSSARRFVARREEILAPLRVDTLLAEVAHGEPAFSFEHPDSGEAIVAIGAVATVTASGVRRFEDAAATADELFSSLDIAGRAMSARGEAVLPRLVGGFAFSDTLDSVLWRDFEPLRLVLPRTQWIRSADRWVRVDGTMAPEEVTPTGTSGAKARGLVTRRCEPSSATAPRREETAGAWRARAKAALGAIEQGRFEKIVLARHESRALAGDVDVAELLAELTPARPSCYTFCVSAGESIFIGSSPEQLVGVQNGMVEADALAGTIARGRTISDDRARAAALSQSDKDLREHAVVVDALRATLSPYVDEVMASAHPSPRAFPEGYHLHTSLRGTLKTDASILEIVGDVHPTPAVCGEPRSETRATLDRVEPDRGWYAGGVGWIDARGEGRFAVALRSGLFADGRMTAWAGAGIVAGSDLDGECDETSLKMRTLLEAVRGRVA